LEFHILVEAIEDLIDVTHFSLNYASLLLDGGDFAIGRKPQNRSAQVVSSPTRLKNRNFNALPNRCGQKTALQLVRTAFA
jgi:hypothetical protein